MIPDISFEELKIRPDHRFEFLGLRVGRERVSQVTDDFG
jgi:hypothetical protein